MSTKKFVKVRDETKIYYRIIGCGKPLVFLHGNGGSSRFFKYQAKYLSKYYRLLFIDNRGHGFSENKANSLTFEMMARDLKDVLDYFKLDKVSLLGFSDGANLAMVFAKMFPMRVDRLILNAGNISFRGTRFISRITSYFQIFLSFVLKPFSAFFKKYYMVSKLLTVDIDVDENDLKSFSFPSLVIVGSHDLIKKSHSRYISSLIPNCKLIEIKNHGHNVAKSNYKLFNKIVVDFLEEKYERKDS